MFCKIFRNNMRIFLIDREYFKKYEHKIKIRCFDLCSVNVTPIHIWAFVQNLSSFVQNLQLCRGFVWFFWLNFCVIISFRFWLYSTVLCLSSHFLRSLNLRTSQLRTLNLRTLNLSSLLVAHIVYIAFLLYCLLHNTL